MNYFPAYLRNLIHQRNLWFIRFQSVWSWEASPIHKRNLQVDVFTRAKPEAGSLIGEVKNRSTDKYSAQEAAAFREKAEILMALEQVEQAVVFVFSRSGFTQEALVYMQAQGMAWTDDEAWIQEAVGSAGQAIEAGRPVKHENRVQGNGFPVSHGRAVPVAPSDSDTRQ